MEVGADLRGGNGILGFWDTRSMCVFGVRVVDMDADTYPRTQPHKVLKQGEWRKKCKYLYA